MAANRVQALTIDTTILVSTSFLSNVNSLPETLAIYRSSVGQSNVVFEYVALRILGDSWTVCLGNTTKSSKHAETMPAGRYTADWPPKSDEP